jgi:transcriptional regulator with XRE-family HTH domain
MLLRSYLKKHGIKQIEFAERLGISRSYLNEIAQRRALNPSATVVALIEQATQGEVKAADLIKEERA